MLLASVSSVQSAYSFAKKGTLNLVNSCLETNVS